MTYTFNSNTKRTNCTQAIKFLYSHGGKILPRRSDGILRYVGGLTRIVSVDRSITFSDLMIKFGELCGESMSLRCKLPSEDIDLLVSIKSDEDLRNVIEEYDRFSLSTNQEVKIRAILSPINSQKKIDSLPSSPMSCFDFPSAPSKNLKPPVTGKGRGSYYSYPPCTAANRCCAPVVGYPVRGVRKETAKVNGCFTHHHQHQHQDRVYFNPHRHYCQ